MGKEQKEEREESLLDKAANIIEDHSNLSFKEAKDKLEGLPLYILEIILKYGDGHVPSSMVTSEELG